MMILMNDVKIFINKPINQYFVLVYFYFLKQEHLLLPLGSLSIRKNNRPKVLERFPDHTKSIFVFGGTPKNK